jgi:hypothetical protein
MWILRLSLFIVMLMGLSINSVSLGSSTAQPQALIDSLDAWTFYDPYDPLLAPLITKKYDSYRLDPNWEVERIEYMYEMSALGGAELDYRFIERNGETYIRDGAALPVGYVQTLISSVEHLYPTQGASGGIRFTDYYPHWYIELRGTDGQTVLIFSDSTGNTNSAPWNVFYNGRFYAQYDGAVAPQIAALFPGNDPTINAFGEPPLEQMSFSMSSSSYELSKDFHGLLPFNRRFNYDIDVENGVIDGYVEGRRQDSLETENPYFIMGLLFDVSGIQITVDNRVIDCEMTSIEATFESSPVWSFYCYIGAHQIPPNAPYRFPITIEIITDMGETMLIDGVLNGVWTEAQPYDLMLLPIEPFVHSAFTQNVDARDLMTDHLLYAASYGTQIEPEHIEIGARRGQAIFVGQTELNGQALRYSLGVQYIVENGQLVHWQLSRSVIDAMLNDILVSPLFNRAIQIDENLILSMWYAETSIGRSDYRVELPQCGEVPAMSLPNEDMPLRAFELNSDSFGFWLPDFVLVNSHPVVADLDLSPSGNDHGPLTSILTPDALQTGDGLARFSRIRINSDFDNQPVRIRIDLPRNASEADLAAYESIAQSFGTNLNIYHDSFDIENTSPGLTDEGEIIVISCED